MIEIDKSANNGPVINVKGKSTIKQQLIFSILLFKKLIFI